MKEFSFFTADKLIKFLENHRDRFSGCVLEDLFKSGGCGVSCSAVSYDTPIMLCINGLYVIVEYYATSNLTLTVAEKNEIANHPQYGWLLKENYDCETRLDDGFDEAKVGSDMIRGEKIVSVDVKRFSDGFLSDAKNDVIRPDGGDYFDTISIVLSNKVTICISPQSALSDGYFDMWIE